MTEVERASRQIEIAQSPFPLGSLVLYVYVRVYVCVLRSDKPLKLPAYQTFYTPPVGLVSPTGLYAAGGVRSASRIASKCF